MPLYLFTISSWPTFPYIHLRCRLPIQRVEGPLVIGVDARKHRFIRQQALSREGHLFIRKLPFYAGLQNHLPLYASGQTHTHTHTHTHTPLCIDWLWNPRRREKLSRESVYPTAEAGRSTRWRTSWWTCPCLGGKQYPTLPMPHLSPGSHAKRVIYSLKDLIKIIQEDVQN